MKLQLAPCHRPPEQHGNHRVQVGPYLFAAVRAAQSHRDDNGTEHQYASGHVKVSREDKGHERNGQYPEIRAEGGVAVSAQGDVQVIL